MTRFLASLGLLLLVSTSAPLGAVERSRDGFGDLLLFPYFSVGGELDTLLSVAARDVVPGPEQSGAVALRAVLRFVESPSGFPLEPLSFNVFLGSGDSWSVALAQSDGRPVVLGTDSSCVQVGRPGALLDGLPVHLDTFDPVFEVVGRGEGWIEVYELGGIAHGMVREAVRQQDCERLWELLDAEDPSTWLTAPDNRLRGVAHLVDAQGGTSFSYAPQALANFRDAPLFTAPSASSPNLGDGSPARASVALDDGGMRHSTFAAHPVQAVSAVLMDVQWDMDFTVETSIAAETDLVVTLPTRAYRGEDGGRLAPFRLRAEAGDGIPTSARFFNREGQLNDPAGQSKCTPPPQLQPGPTLAHHLNVLEFGPEGLLSSTLGDALLWYYPGLCNLGPAEPVHLWIEAGRLSLRFPEDTLVSDEGHVFTGIPAIALGLSRAVNGNLGGVLANYGLLQPVARKAGDDTP